MAIQDILAQICAGPRHFQDLDERQAETFYAAMLDGDVAPFETGAALAALRWKRESIDEIAGFVRATNARMLQVDRPPGQPRCVVIPSYGRSHTQPNLMPLLATMLARFGVPVIVHGNHGAAAPIPAFQVLQQLGHLAVETLADAENELALHNLALVPTRVLSPKFAALLALRERLSMRNSAYVIAKFLDPCPGFSLRLTCVSDPDLMERMRRFLVREPGRVLLMRATEGEAYANPFCRPRIELFDEGANQVLFEAESRGTDAGTRDARMAEPAPNAALVAEMLDGHRLVPQPLLNQLAACLYASGHTPDLARAKALVALRAPLAAHG
jgi:anthranilate phosphoribosyltransferase